MTENQLPEGVPADNTKMSAGEPGPSGRSSASGQVLPDMATPHFSHDRVSAPVALEERGKASPPARSRDKDNLTILIAVVALSMALGAIFMIYKPRENMPLCSELPEWNQYNCRVG